MEYKVITAEHFEYGQKSDSLLPMERLTELVNEAIKEGWKCQGGVQMCVVRKYDDMSMFNLFATQAMVRE